MENKYLRHTDDEWLAIINECRSSGDSDRIWCQEHHITLSTFYYLIRRLRKKACCIPESVKSAGRIQEVVQLDFDTQERYPVPLSTVTSPGTAVKIIFHGIQIEISNTAASDTIYHTLSALQRLC